MATEECRLALRVWGVAAAAAHTPRSILHGAHGALEGGQGRGVGVHMGGGSTEVGVGGWACASRAKVQGGQDGTLHLVIIVRHLMRQARRGGEGGVASAVRCEESTVWGEQPHPSQSTGPRQGKGKGRGSGKTP